MNPCGECRYCGRKLMTWVRAALRRCARCEFERKHLKGDVEGRKLGPEVGS